MPYWTKKELETIKIMQKKLIDSELKEELNSLDFDIKAEAFFINFLEDYNIHYKFKDYFERGYSKDIKDIQTSKNSIPKTHYAYLTRLGFYDIFPEVLFHTSNSAGYTQEMVENYKERKKEEAYAKDFFQPLENELFTYLLDSEKQEATITSALGDREFLILLRDIWDIDRRLPYQIMVKVYKFIPFIHKISGDINAITYMLEHIFDDKIILTEKPLYINNTSSDESELRLGDNFALKAPNITYLKKYIFTFTNIKKINQITEYFDNGKIHKIISLFLNYTIPFENDFEIEFTIAKSKQTFVLDNKPYSGRMNISTKLAS